MRGGLLPRFPTGFALRFRALPRVRPVSPACSIRACARRAASPRKRSCASSIASRAVSSIASASLRSAAGASGGPSRSKPLSMRSTTAHTLARSSSWRHAPRRRLLPPLGRRGSPPSRWSSRRSRLPRLSWTRRASSASLSLRRTLPCPSLLSAMRSSWLRGAPRANARTVHVLHRRSRPWLFGRWMRWRPLPPHRVRSHSCSMRMLRPILWRSAIRP